MFIDNDVVEILCMDILTMEHCIEYIYHEIFLSTLKQLFLMSPHRVKNICRSFENFKNSLLLLQDLYSYVDEFDQVWYYFFLILIFNI